MRRLLAGVTVTGLWLSLAAVPLFSSQEAGAYPQDPPDSGTMASGVSARRAWNGFYNGWNGVWTYPCDTLYGVRDNNLYRYTNLNVAAASRSATSQRIAQGNPSWTSTLAMGQKPDGTGVMYMWQWDHTGVEIFEFPSGSTTASTPAAGTSVTYTVPKASGGTWGSWSGGEVDQMTGNIVFSGREDATFRGSGSSTTAEGFRMMIFNPQTGQFKQSGKIYPVSSATNASNDINNSYIGSDMALDANGNMYVIVGSDTGSAPYRWLVRIVPNRNQAWQPWSQRTSPTAGTGWVYDKVVRLTGDISGTDVWGMSFFKGMLYAAIPNKLIEINPLTGASRNLGESGQDMLDLGGCEVAPVIEGTVYIDKDGDGVISDAEKTDEANGRVTGATVQLYNSTGVFIGSQQTSSTGSYSFLVNDTNSDYYVRLVQPTSASGINGRQTWAGQEDMITGTQNGVTPYCLDLTTGNAVGLTTSGACYGATLAGVDAGGTLSGVSAVTSQSAIYSKVTMTTSRDVADADFGVTFATSWGDAPETYRTTRAAGGPRHIVLTDPDAPLAKLGSRVVAYSDGEPSTTASLHDADGVEICNLDGSACQPLQGAAIVPGKHYKFQIHVTHNVEKEKVWISGWAGGWNAGASIPAGTWLTANPIATNVHPNDFGDYEVLDWVAPNNSVATSFFTFARFRVTISDTAPNLTPEWVAPTATTPWAPLGEVEDYAISVVSGKTQVGVRTLGEGSGTGSFTFTATNTSDNHTGSLGSFISTAVLSTPTALSTTWDKRLHAFSNAGTDVAWRMAVSGTTKVWTIATATCTDGGTPVTGVTLDADKLGFKIPGAAVVLGSDISCLVELVSDPDPANSVLELQTTNPVVADGTAVHTLRATVNGPTLPAVGMSGVTVSWVISDKGSTLPTTALAAGVAQQTCVTNPAGQCSISFPYSGTLPEADGTKHFDVHASIATAGVPAAAISGSPKEVIFRSGPICTSPNTSTFWVTPKPPSEVSTNTGVAQVHIVARDCQGNGIPDYDVSKLMWFTSDPLGTFSPGASAFTRSTAGDALQGEYVADIKSSVIGDKTIQAKFEVPSGAWVSGISVPTLPSSDPLKNEVARFATNDPPCTSPVTTTYWVEPDTSLVVGDGSANRAKVYVAVRDCSNNPLDKYDVGRLKWHTNDPLGSNGGTPAPNGSAFTTTSTPGVFVADLYSYAAGNKNVEVKFESTSDWPSGTNAIADTGAGKTNRVAHYIPGPPSLTTTTFWVTPIPPAVTAVSSGTANVYVAVRDAYGNPLSGYSESKLVWHTDQTIGTSPNGTAFAPVSGQTGVFVAEIKSTEAGDKTIAVKAESTDGTWATGTLIGVDTASDKNNAVASFEAGAPCTSPVTSTYWVEPETDLTVGPSNKATVYLRLRDCDGNDVPASKVNTSSLAWQIGSSESLGAGTVNSSFVLQSGTTSTYVAEFYSTIAGQKHVSARFNVTGGVWASGASATAGEAGKTNTIARYVADPVPNPTTSTFWVTPKPPNEVSVGTGAANVYVAVADSFGNPITDYDKTKLAWQSTASLGTSPTTSAFVPVSGQPGVFVAEIKSTNLGDKPIQARFEVVGGNWASGTAISVLPSPDPLKNETARFSTVTTPDHGTYWVEPATDITVGTSVANQARVYLHLFDAYDNDLDGVDVSQLAWNTAQSLGSYGAHTPFAPVGSTAPGVYVATFYSTVAGNKNIEARFNVSSGVWASGIAATATEAGKTNTVARYIPAPPSGMASTYFVSTGTVGLADGTSPGTQDHHVLTVTVRDEYGNPISSSVNNLAAYIRGEVQTPATSSGVTVTGFVPVAGDGGQYTAYITSTLEGDKTMRALVDAAKTGSFVAAAVEADGTPPVAKNRIASFGGNPPEPTKSFYSVTGTVVPVAPTAGQHTVTVRLFDNLNNAKTGEAAKLWFWIDGIATPAGVTLGHPFTETATPGRYTATISSTVAANYPLKAGYGVTLADAQAAGNQLTVDLTLNSGNTVAHFQAGVEWGPGSYFEVSTGTKTVETQTHTVTVHLVDGAGNPITGKAASLSPSSLQSLRATGDSSVGRIGTFAETAPGSGVYTATIYSTSWGEKVITVDYIDASSPALPYIESVAPPGSNITHNNVARFESGLPDLSNSYFSVEPAAVVTGTSAPVNAYIFDKWGNPVSGKQAQFGLPTTTDPISSGSFTGHGDAFSELTGVGNEGHYRGGLTSYVTGGKTISVTFGGNPVPYTAPGRVANFVAGGVDVVNPGTYFKVTTGSEAVNTGSHTVTAYLVDQYGNPVTGQTSLNWSVIDEALPSDPTPIGTFLPTSFSETSVGSGVYTAAVKSSKSGTKIISVKFGPDPVSNRSNNDRAVFEAGPVDLSKSIFWVPSTAEKTVKAETHTVYAYLRDAAGNPASGHQSSLAAATYPTNLGVTGGITTFTPVAGTPGLYQATIDSEKAGTFVVSVTYSSTAVAVGTSTEYSSANGNREAKFNAAVPKVTPYSQYTVSTGYKTVGTGVANQHEITVRITDQYDNGLDGMAGYISASVSPDYSILGLGSVSAFTTTSAPVGSIDDGKGYYKATVTSTLVGDKPILVRLDAPSSAGYIGLKAGGNSHALFEASTPVAANSYYNVSTGPVSVAGGSHTITVVLRDAYNNLVPDTTPSTLAGNISVTTTDPLGSGSVTLPAVHAGAGVYNSTITSSIIGSKTITARYSGVAIPAGPAVGANTVAQFDNSNCGSNLSWYWVDDATAKPADNVATHTVRVFLADTAGNGCAGRGDTLTDNRGNLAGVTFGPISDDLNGNYSYTIKASTAGDRLLTVGFGATPLPVRVVGGITSNATARFVAGAVFPGNSIYTVSVGSVPVGSTHTVTVTLKDAIGNVVSRTEEAAKLWTSVGSSLGDGVTFGPWTMVTDGDGNPAFRATITSTKAGSKPIIVKYGTSEAAGTGLTYSVNGTAQYEAGSVDLSKSSFRVTEGPQVAGSGSHTITVNLADAYGNPVTLSLSQLTGLSATPTPNLTVNVGAFASVSGTPGQYTASVTSNLIGGKTIEVRYGGTVPRAVISGVAANDVASFVAGPYSAANSSWIVVSDLPVPVTSTHTLRVTLQDTLGNPISLRGAMLFGETRTDLVTMVTGFAETGTGTGIYEATITTTLAGNKLMTVAYDHDANPGTPVVAVGLGATGHDLARFAADPPSWTESYYTVGSDTVAVGGNVGIDIFLMDQHKNPITGQATLFHANTISGALPVTYGPITEVAGEPGHYRGTVSSTAAGDKVVGLGFGATAPYQTVTYKTNQVAHFDTAVCSAVTYWVTPDVKTVGTGVGSAHTLYAVVTDTYGNRCATSALDYDVAGSIGSGVKSPFAPTGATGVYTATVTSTVSGSHEVTVRLGSATYGTVADATVSAVIGGVLQTGNSNKYAQWSSDSARPDQSYFWVTTGTKTVGLADDNAHIVQVLVRDQHGNPVTGQAGNIAVGSSDAYGLGGAGSVGETGTAGVYSVLFKSTVSGDKTVNVTLGGAPLAVGPTAELRDNRTARFAPGTPDVTNPNSKYWVISSAVVEPIAATHTVRVQLADGYGNLVTVSPSILQGRSEQSLGTGRVAEFAGSAGIYDAVISSSVDVNAQIRVRYDSTEMSVRGADNSLARFQATTAVPGTSSFWVSTGDKLVGGIESHTISVKLRSSGDGPVTGQAANLSAQVVGGIGALRGDGDTSAGRIGAFTEVTPGNYEAQVFSTRSGAKQISVRWDDTSAAAFDLSVDAVQTNNLARFIVGPGTEPCVIGSGVTCPKQYYSVDTTSQVVGHTIPVWVHLTDSWGNDLTGAASAIRANTAASLGLSGNISTFTALSTPPALAPVDQPSGWYRADVLSSDSPGDKSITVRVIATSAAIALGGNMNDIARFTTGPICLTQADCPGGPVSSFEVTTGEALVNTGAHTVTVKVFNTEGTPISGQASAASWATVDELGSFSTTAFTEGTGANTGTYTATIKSEKSGGKVITTALTGVGAIGHGTSNDTATFKADGPTVAKSSFWVTTGDKTVKTAEHTLTIVLRDNAGNLVPDLAAQIHPSAKGLATGTPPRAVGEGFGAGYGIGTVTQVSPGVYQAAITSTLAGSWQLDVTFGAGASAFALKLGTTADEAAATGNDTAKFTPGTPDWATHTWMTVTTGDKVVGTGTSSQHTITLYIGDDADNGIGDQLSKLGQATATGGIGGGTISPWTALTGADIGKYTATITSTVAGDKVVSATWDGTAFGAGVVDIPAGKTPNTNKTARFIADTVCSPLGSHGSYSVTTGQVAINTGQHKVTVELRDCSNNLTDAGVVVSDIHASTIEPLGTGSISGFTRLSQGVYEATITSALDGQKQIDATYGAATLAAGVVAGVSANTIADFTSSSSVVDPAKSWFEVSTGLVVANNSDSHTITVTLRDASGNRLTGRAAGLTATPTPATGVSVVLPFTEATGLGVGVYTTTVKSTTSGDKALAVRFGGADLAAVTPMDLAGGGTALNDVAAFKAGPVVLLNSEFTVSLGQQPVTTGTHTVTVKLHDSNNNPVTGKASALTPDANPSAGVSFGAFVEGPDGTYVAQISSTSAGIKVIAIELADGTTSGPVPFLTNRAEFVAGPIKPDDPDYSWYVVSTGTKIAGKQTHTVTVHFEDASHNPVIGLTPAVLATVAPTAAPSSGYTFGAFAATTTAGEYSATISAIHVGSTTVTLRYGTENVHVRVVGGVDQNKIAVFGPDEATWGLNSDYSVTTGSVLVGTGTHTVTVKLADDRSEPISGKATQLFPSAPAGTLGGGAITGFVESLVEPGTYTAHIASTKTGTKAITVAYDHDNNSVTPPVAVAVASLPGGGAANTNAVFHTEIVDPGHSDTNYTVTSDKRAVTATHTVTVNLSDKDGNGVPSQASKLYASLETPDGTVSFGPFIPMIGVEGVYTATVSSSSAGDKVVVIKHGATSATAVPLNFLTNKTARFVEGDVSYADSFFWVTTGDKTVGTSGASAHTVTVALRDDMGNPVGGKAADLTREFTGSIGSGAFATFAETSTYGTYTATITSTVTGAKSITVKYLGAALLLGDSTVGGTNNRLARFVTGPGGPDPADSATWFGVTKGDKNVGTSASVNGHTITVSLADSFGNPITGAQAQLKGSATGNIGGGAVSGFTETADPGLYEATITSTIKGTKPVSVIWSDGAATVAIVNLPPTPTTIDNHVANFVVPTSGPVCPTDPSSKFWVTSDVRVVGLGAADGHIVTVQLADCYGNLITGYDTTKLDWQTDQSLGLGTISTFTESAVEGQYTARIKSTVDGDKVIRALDITGPLSARGANVTARFKNGPTDPANPDMAWFDVTTPEVPIRTGTHTVTVKLYDAFSNGVVGVAGLLEITPTPSVGVSVGAVAPVTGHPGWYSAAVTSTSVGVKTITVKLDGDAVHVSGYGTATTGNDKARFKSGPVDPAESSFYVSTGDEFVGTGTHTITVVLKDADGNPVVGAESLLARAATPNAGVTASALTPAATAGTYTATVRSTVPGVKTISVSYDGDAVSPRTPAENKASFITNPDDPCLTCDATGYVVSSGTVQVPAGEHIVTVSLVDTYGNGVVGAASKLFGRTVASSLGTGAISAFSPVVGSDGVYQAKITSSVSGDKQIKVRFGSIGGAEVGADGNDLARFGSGTVDLSGSDYWVAPGPQTVNTTAQIRVYLQDVAGNPATGEAAGLTAYSTDNLGLPSSSAFSTFSPDPVDAGWYVASVKSLSAGLKTIHVRYGGVDIATVTATHGNTTTFTAETIIDPANDNTFYSVSTGNKVVLDAPHVITVQVADQYGNLIPGNAATLSATLRVGQSIGSGTISGFIETGTPGIYTANVSSSVAGGKNLQAKVTLGASVYSIALNGNGVARFVPAAFDPNNDKSGFTVSTGVQMVASGQHLVEARLADIYGNLIGGKADDLTAGTTFDIGTGTITAFEQLTDEDGPYYVAYITSTKAGAKAISVKLEGASLIPDGNQQARFRATGPWVDNPSTSFSVTESVRKVGTGIHTVTIRVADRYGNPVSGAESQLWLYVLDDIGEGSITEPTEDPTEPGTYTAQITSTKVGAKQVTVQIGVRTVHHGSYNDIATFVAGDPDMNKSTYRVSEGDQPIITGSHTVTVKLVDRYANPVTGQAVKLDASTKHDIGTGTISTFTESTRTPGTYTAKITSSKPGAKLVAVEDSEAGPVKLAGNDTASFVSSVDVANAGTRYWVTEGVQTPVTGRHTVTIQLADVAGNAITGAAGDIHIAVAGDIGSGQIGSVTESSVTPGTYTASLTSSVYGVKTVTVSYGEDCVPIQLGGNGNATADFGSVKLDGTPTPVPSSPGLDGSATPTPAKPGSTLPFTGADVAIPAAIAGLLFGLGGLLLLVGLRKRRRGEQTEEAAA